MPSKSATLSESAVHALRVVDKARFKVFPVSSLISVDKFLQGVEKFLREIGVEYSAGKAFYQLTKTEIIDAEQEIVALRKSDGLQITGSEVHDLLKIDSSARQIEFVGLPDFDVFVQNDSSSRNLSPGTQMLYEVAPEAISPSELVPRREKPAFAHSETRNGEAPTYLAGSVIELVFSFDTTGSMSRCLDQVRGNLRSMITRILSDVPNIRIAVFAHGDYCDRHRTYLIKHIDFTTDLEKLVTFVSDVGETSGGDWAECYELVMHEARTKLSWIPDSQRAMVMIGDAVPHSVDAYKTDSYCKAEPMLDWRKEADGLLAMGCRVYSVQYREHEEKEADEFWAGLAYKTYGHHLELKNWDNILHFITAIAFSEFGHNQLEAYRQEVIKSTPGGGSLNDELHVLFDSLAKDHTTADAETADTVSETEAPPAKKLKLDEFSEPDIVKKAKISRSPKKTPTTASWKLTTVKSLSNKAYSLFLYNLSRRRPITRAQARKALAKYLSMKSTPRKSPTTRSSTMMSRITRAQTKLMCIF